MNMGMYIPVLLAFFVPLLLWIGGKLNVAPGIRFKLTGMLIIIMWTLACLLMSNSLYLNSMWCWLAGILFLSSVLMVSFMFWSVLCWGYTLSMLICLDKYKSINSLQHWENHYAGASGISKLTKDRSMVLVNLRFASMENDELVLTHYGRINAVLLRYVSQIFGITR